MSTRRQALRAGGLVAASLAGCLGSSPTASSGDGTTTDDHSTTIADTTTESRETSTDGATTDDSTTSDATDALRWTVDTGGAIGHAPVVVGGTVYASSRALHAVATDGTERWQFAADVPVQSRALVRDAGVYVVTGSFQGSPAGEQFAAHALDPDGAERWSDGGDGVGMVSVLDATSDAAYVGTHDDYLQQTGESLYALDAGDGDQRWDADIGDAEGGVVVGDTVVVGYRLGVAGFAVADGTARWRASARSLGGVVGDAVVVGGQSTVRALGVADGTERWTFTPPEAPSAASVADGTVYVGTRDGGLHAVDGESGEERWRAASGGTAYAQPTVTADAVYVAGDGVRALDPDTGEERWRFDTGQAHARLAASRSGVYVAAGETLQALGTDGSERWRYEAAGRLTRPVVDRTGVYVGDKSGTLAALSP